MDAERTRMPNMTDAETAAHLREWVKQLHGLFSWPTDACGYNQHVRFAEYRNQNWHGEGEQEFNQFILDYADSLTN